MDDSNQKLDKHLDKIKKLAQKDRHLKPEKADQKDFFIADIFNATSFKDEIASMEHPMFALKAGDIKTRHYEHNGISITVAPSAEYGLATIHDKDIWIYCISKLIQAINEGEEPSQTIRFTIYDFLNTTNKGTDGRYYENAKAALDRLAGTRLTTEWRTKTHKVAKNIGLIDHWKIIEEKDGRMVRVEVKLPDWLYESALEPTNLLTISHDYFRLRKPLDRRIYEIARKHCGEQAEFKISLELLQKKTGATTPLRNFRIAIKSLAASNELPDYSVSYDEEKDQVIFKNIRLLKSLTALAETHCKDKKRWIVSIEFLFENTEHKMQLEQFINKLKSIAQRNELIDYAITFNNRNCIINKK